MPIDTEHDNTSCIAPACLMPPMKRLALLLCLPLAAAAAPVDPAALEHTLDAMVASRFKADGPGVAALVVKDGKPVLRTVNGHRLVGHGGYILNFYSEVEMDIDEGIVTVTLHNGDRLGGDNEVLSKQMIMAAQDRPERAPAQ
jgi:hypothetical protein